MDGSINNLREAVLTDARARAYEATQDAKKHGDEVAAGIETQIAGDRAAAMASAEVDAEKQRQRLLAEVEAEIQKERLDAREKMIARVVEEVRKRLGAAASDRAKGRGLLLQLSVEGVKAVSGTSTKLVVRSSDRNWVDGAFLSDVAAQAGKRAELSEETHDRIGGVIVTTADGRERFDNTLDNRLARQMDDVRAMIWARVSHAG